LLLKREAKMLFIESFCRVYSLSLSGKLLYPIVDKFVVHWKELKERYPRSIFLQKEDGKTSVKLL
jgi:beta-1,4-N-acetylglucosaminyltransferase